MIAMKREVAARQMNKLVQVFRGANVKLGNWRQVTVQVKNLSSESFEDREKREEAYCTKSMHICVRMSRGYARACVQSPLVVLIYSAKRRRLFLWQVK